jgi:Zn-dependent peptidase ImmA (M78 family)/transcriptional regulator with XRE-family HTH domain
MSSIKINPKMLTLAREARGLSQSELADKLSISQSNLSKMEQEFIAVNHDVFKTVQKTLCYPEGFFFQEGEILPPAFYRKRDKVAFKTLLAIEANINIYRFNIEQLAQTIKYDPTPIPCLTVEKFGSPEAVAKQLRKLWKVGKGTVEDLTGLMEAHGILIVSFDFGTERVDGRSLLTNDKHPVIFLNKALLGDRLRFTLAYELGHLVMHANTTPKFGADVSQEAIKFAAEFIMPEKDILPDFDQPLTIQRLAELKKKWKISMQAILYRAHELGAITDNQKRYLIGVFNSMQIRRREPPELDIIKETPVLLRNLITNYRTKQKISVKEIANLFHLEQEEFLARFS